MEYTVTACGFFEEKRKRLFIPPRLQAVNATSWCSELTLELQNFPTEKLMNCGKLSGFLLFHVIKSLWFHTFNPIQSFG